MQARQGLTIATGAPVSPGRSGVQKNTATPASAANTRSSSPVRPPVSPITPTFGPTKLPGDVPTSTALASKPPGSSSSSTSRAAGPNAATAAAAVVVDAVAAAEQKFAQDRKAFTHAQPDQVGAVPPAAEPIAFDDNPDVLAIQSAITILQLQRAKAMADMQALSRIKNDALADPAAFLADLQAGRVRAEGDRLFVESVAGEDEDEDDSSSEDDDADDEKNTPAAAAADENMMDVDAQPAGEEKIAAGPAAAKAKRKRQGNKANTPAKSWHKLPKPQNIVRTPPVNWAQYGVMGESLDKLHAEQRAAPAQGTPLTLGAGRTFEFKAGDQPAGEQRRLVGIAAPYTPGKDKLDKKGKGAKR